jgi:hypothetical protein
MYFVYMYECETLKPVILRRERGKRENSGGDEPNQDTLCTNIQMSPRVQLIKIFFKILNGCGYLCVFPNLSTFILILISLIAKILPALTSC